AVCDGPSSLRSLQPDLPTPAPCAHCCLHHGGPDLNHNPLYLLGRAAPAGNRAPRGRPLAGGPGEDPCRCGCEDPARGRPCDDSLHKGHVTPPGILGRGAAAAPLLCSQHAPLPACHCEGCPMGRLAVGVRGRAAANQEIRVDL
ncbi:unnamed protein product, partial [Lampetra planeri]